MQMDASGLSIGSNSKNIVAHQWEKSLIQQEPSQVFQQVTIKSLPDDVLLDIFDFYQVVFNKDSQVVNEYSWNWETLVHVCRRWRYIIFESPIRLNLQLFCTETSPVRKLLDVWPPYPLVIRFKVDYSYFIVNLEPGIDSTVTDNLIGALERRDRVREIRVHITNPQNRPCERIIAAMEKPFPALRSFYFKSGDHSEEVILDTLSNGSAPCLRTLALWEISFPSLPRLLSSTSDLTSLCLFNAGYIRPETMATSLSALPKLECLIIAFETSTPHLERRNRAPPLQTRFVLPALTSIAFYGVNKILSP
ncbi:hypothetical protein BGW80DRAFT_807229 [Lactifluus volemus]|nr:hypothetical protein BGW80DRAFT_807229 [Lactifluus volemus]